jgi:endonuclease/exonuclease/phosphatase family metal-dependent hydrolase
VNVNKTPHAHIAVWTFAVVLAGMLCPASGLGGEVKPVGCVTVVQWNAENLFDAEDDPSNPADDEFTPSSWRHWTEARYAHKLEGLARVLAEAAGDIILLEEIENRRVLDDLRSVLETKHGLSYPVVVHREGPDHRGIDVAILARFPADRVEWILPVPEQREIIVADFSPGGEPLTVVANHWKSHMGKEAETDTQRVAQARAVGQIVRARLLASPGAAILVAGDFNSDFDSQAIVGDLGSGTNQAVGPSGDASPLYNMHAGLDASKRGTIYYKRGKEWNSFDSMHVTRVMLDATLLPEGWKVLPDSYEVFSRPYMLRDGIPIPYRLATQPGTKKRVYDTGFSDHLPVRIVLRRSTAP